MVLTATVSALTEYRNDGFTKNEQIVGVSATYSVSFVFCLEVNSLIAYGVH